MHLLRNYLNDYIKQTIRRAFSKLLNDELHVNQWNKRGLACVTKKIYHDFMYLNIIIIY